MPVDFQLLSIDLLLLVRHPPRHQADDRQGTSLECCNENCGRVFVAHDVSLPVVGVQAELLQSLSRDVARHGALVPLLERVDDLIERRPHMRHGRVAVTAQDAALSARIRVCRDLPLHLVGRRAAVMRPITLPNYSRRLMASR